ncbi:MAG TPA: PDZ domain-containing protein [Phycisphaerae bacterium]|nr:PDZ domain-containing protein [Phycisphaerae bacterium]HNU43765.1 PDZ domain-containing protein [Phycisphaerae bacterium]
MKILLAALLLHGFVWGGQEALATACGHEDAPSVGKALAPDGQTTACAGRTVTCSATAAATGDEGTAREVVVVAPSGGMPGCCLKKAPGGSSCALSPMCISLGDGGLTVGVAPNEVKYVAETITAAADDAEQDSGWLGVWLGEIPEALAAQLDLEGRGVLVLQVEDNSPAANAGIKAHDILVKIDDAPIAADVAALGQIIRKHKAGERVNIALLRGGKEQTLEAELGKRPAVDALTHIYNFSPRDEIEERLFTKGRMYKQTPQGKWFTHELKLEELPFFSGKVGSQSMKIITEGVEQKVIVTVDKDGNSLVVTKEKDGKVTVARTDKDGKNTETTYATEEELSQGDPEAAELLTSVSGEVRVEVELDGLDTLLEKIGELSEDIKTEVSTNALPEYKDRLREAEERLKEAMERVKELNIEGWDPGADAQKHFRDAQKKFRWFARSLPGDEGVKILSGGVDKPAYSFLPQADGSIEVRIRKGDAEVVQTFANEEELASKQPKLAEKYRALLAPEEE